MFKDEMKHAVPLGIEAEIYSISYSKYSINVDLHYEISLVFLFYFTEILDGVKLSCYYLFLINDKLINYLNDVLRSINNLIDL